MNHKELHEAFSKAYDGVGVPDDKRTDLANPEYVECIYDLVKARKPQQILELGVEYGFSTVAMLLAAKEYGGRVWSVDVKMMGEAVKAVGNLRLLQRWSWFQMDDLKFAETWAFNPLKFNCIYIDTDHTYEQCRDEIEAFYPFLESDGIMAFHDISWNEGREIHRAIQMFLSSHRNLKYIGYRQDIGIIYTGRLF